MNLKCIDLHKNFSMHTSSWTVCYILKVVIYGAGHLYALLGAWLIVVPQPHPSLEPGSHCVTLLDLELDM